MNIPNYEKRSEPLPYQFPLSAKDSMDYTQAPVGFRLELFASEPDVINPIGLAWDEREGDFTALPKGMITKIEVVT